jgi:hypothetical protein
VAVIQEIFQCPLRRMEDESIHYILFSHPLSPQEDIGIYPGCPPQTIIFDTLILYPPQRTLEYLLDDHHRPLYLILSSSILLRGHWNISWMTADESIKYNGMWRSSWRYSNVL